MAVHKSLFWLVLSIALVLVLLLIPRVTLSDNNNISKSSAINTVDYDKEHSYQLLEEEYFLYLQDHLNESNNHKNMLASTIDLDSVILLSDIVSSTPPAWCSQHFVDE